MRAIFVFVSFFIFSSVCSAHRDTKLTLTSDGTISGLPSKFGAAKLQLSFSTSKKVTSISGGTFILGKNKTSLPRCITKLLKSSNSQDIQIAGSWYHNEQTLPYYLNVDFLDSKSPKSHGARDGYSLLFNLHTGKLLRIERHYSEKSNSSTNGIAIVNKPIDINTACPGNDKIALLGTASDVK